MKIHSQKSCRRAKSRLRWLWVWLIQIAAMLLISLLTALSLWLGGGLHAAFRWALMPIAGCISACIATRAGLWNYAAWIAPPVMQFLGHVLVWAYAPDPGAVFFCGFVSLVGAAAGEVLNRQHKR